MNVKNPAYSQTAPNITVTGRLIPAKGPPTLFNSGKDYILLQNVDQTVPSGVNYGGNWHDAVPLEVRGSASFLTKTISQSNAQPGAQNEITVTFATSVPLSAGGSLITLSGFHPLGQVTLVAAADFSLDTSATTNTSVVIKVVTATMAGENYPLKLQITNPVKHTLSP
eukprot:662658-Hanusia_phi.AAC.1